MISKRFEVEPEILSRMYWEEGLTLLEIGKCLGLAGRTVDIRMHECGIPLRKSGVPCAEIDRKTLKSLYIKSGLSSRKIARIYKCAYSTIDRKIRGYGFPIKTLAAAHIVTKRKPFDGTSEDKAYLVGFRIGDLRVHKKYDNSETILIDCGSTHSAQINLIRSLFSKYGRVWTSKPTRLGKIQIECGVDLSFSFLLEKTKQFPRWTFKSKPLFLSLLAGFTDAEGCFYLSRDRKRSAFSIGNYNLRMLKQIKLGLEKMGYVVRLALGSKKGYKGEDGYIRRGDYWILSLNRKNELLKFSGTILPYLKHREKIEDARKVIKSIEWRNKIYGQ